MLPKLQFLVQGNIFHLLSSSPAIAPIRFWLLGSHVALERLQTYNVDEIVI